MSSDVERHVLARIRAATLETDPFPHCVVDGVFPEEFYERIIDHWPEDACFEPLGDTGRVSRNAYRERRVILVEPRGFARLSGECLRFWRDEVAGWLTQTPLALAVLERFAAELDASGHGLGGANAAADALIVSDRTNYAIGPHTDSPARVVSLLFYLPEDATFRRFGTSLYRPRDAGRRCPGGPHHDVREFVRARTVEFLPNRLLLFPKSDRCFHGVERVDLDGIERRLLIYDLQRARSA